MREWIDKIIVVDAECKDPIKDFRARQLRDDAFEALAKEVFHMNRKDFEALANTPEEKQLLGWFYTRFIHNKFLSAHGDLREKR